MVARIVIGKGVKGAMNYNENKVRKGCAELLHAEGYHKDKDALSFDEKLTRFTRLTELAETIKANGLHISLNFDPSEQLSNERLVAIAETYMQKIGFGKQPYLVYRHDDAAHPHLHIVTTNVQMNGKGISLHNIGMEKSEPARKEIEELFGLVKAEGRKQSQGDILKPVAAKLIYGKEATKAAISNVVRAVVRDYRFASLAELNAILRELNVEAYRGGEGTRQFEKKGLSYCMLDEAGNRIGVPIKASGIYSKPTLVELEKKFDKKAEQRKPYRDRLKNIIDKALASGFIPDKEAFRELLAAQGVSVIFRQNDTMVYGITYIDHKSKCVFNGSALSSNKEYNAKRIMERIGVSGFGEHLQRQRNKAFADKLMPKIDYRKGAAKAIASMYAKGLRIRTDKNGEYYFGRRGTKESTYERATKKLSAYFILNGITTLLLRDLTIEADKWDTGRLPEASIAAHLQNYVGNLLAAIPEPSLPMQPPKRKKRKRKPNW